MSRLLHVPRGIFLAAAYTFAQSPSSNLRPIISATWVARSVRARSCCAASNTGNVTSDDILFLFLYCRVDSHGGYQSFANCTSENGRYGISNLKSSLHTSPEIGRASCRERVCQYV